MDSLTKGVVIVSTLAAAAVVAHASALGFSPVLNLSLAGFLVAFVAGAFVHTTVARIVLAAVYVTPAGFLLWAGADHYTNEIAWIAPLLGLAISGKEAWRWQVPAPWRWPLAAWALVVAVSWPIVALREMDFAPWILDLPFVSNTSIGIAPGEAITWVAYVVLGHNVGLLWLDFLCRAFSRHTMRAFRASVLYPLAGGAIVACLVGAYQGFVDINAISGHVWPRMNRAAGTLMDANAFGMIVALWGPAFVALAAGVGGVLAAVAGATAVVLSFVGVWTSGSRTALAALVVGLAGVAQHGLHVWRSRGRHRSLSARLAPIVIGVTLVIAAAAWIAGRSTTTTVFQRIPSLVPGMDDTTFGSAVFQLWDRFGYGTAAWAMIKEHPLVGIGVGSFNTLVHDYSVWVNHFPIPPDNAQSWYRHHIAELGLLGSLPWLFWCAFLLRALVAPRDASDPSARILRGPLVALGLVSLLGVPAQSVAVAVTIWTFIFWYLLSAGELDRSAVSATGGLSKTAWALMLLLVVAQAVGTYAAGRDGLRPADRALRFGWDYRYGLYPAEADADGGVGRRWAMKESVAVIPVEGRVLKFVCWNDHPEEAPLHVRAWAGSTLVVDTTLRRGESTAADIPAPEGQPRIVIRTWVDRTFSPAEHGVNDTRQLGLAMSDWNWQP